MTRRTRMSVVGGTFVAAAAIAVAPLQSQEPSSVDADDLAGLVRSAGGVEAGVWVIAETDDLDTRFRKIVVTDGEGRFVVPDLPEASYRVWVRGYGLVDSEAVTAEPGQTLTFEAVTAGSPQEASRVYPANYWYSLLEPPAADEFPGTGPGGNGIAEGLKSQAAWVDVTKQGVSCVTRWAIGSRST